MFGKPRNEELESLPSSEEKFIADFLRSKKIKYEREVELGKLHSDTKKFRRADFYLPKFHIYIEYFGQYNSTKIRRNEYDEKAKIYIKNNIPTIFLYPHELGFLEYAFHQKAVRIFKIQKFHLDKEFFKYKLNRFKENVRYGGLRTFITTLYIYYILHNSETGLAYEFEFLLKYLCFLIILLSGFEILKDLWKYFYRDR